MVSELVLCAVLFLGADAQPQPAPTQPAPTQPAPTQPAPTQPAAPAETAEQPEPAPAKAKVELISIEKDIIERTNAERAQYGLPPFEVDPNLQESARAHAAWMTNNYAFRHTNQPVAENIAMGQQSGEEVVRCWMNSSGHRANILNGGHRRIGAAAYRTVQGTIFWCQQFMN